MPAHIHATNKQNSLKVTRGERRTPGHSPTYHPGVRLFCPADLLEKGVCGSHSLFFSFRFFSIGHQRSADRIVPFAVAMPEIKVSIIGGSFRARSTSTSKTMQRWCSTCMHARDRSIEMKRGVGACLCSTAALAEAEKSKHRRSQTRSGRRVGLSRQPCYYVRSVAVQSHFWKS
jgi:hypothetical protein